MADICVVGLGKLGLPFAVSLAQAGHRVWGVDGSLDVVTAVNERTAGTEETGLNRALLRTPMLAESRGLIATTDLALAAPHASVTFILVPTPSIERTGDFDSTAVADVIRRLAEIVPSSHVIAVCSTLSPGTVENVLRPAAGALRLVYTPFLIALGSVMRDLADPDLRLIGASHEDNAAGEMAAGILDSLGTAPTALLTPTEAEIAKLAINAYVVQKIAFANMLAVAAERMDADGAMILAAIGRDKRIGHSYLRPGGWAGGPCFPRDSNAMVEFLQRVDVPAELPVAAGRTNDWQCDLAYDFLRPYARVTVLGLSYKPDTYVTEGSLGLAVARRLVADGVIVTVHDPMALPPDGLDVRYYSRGPDLAAAAGDAVFVATAWRDYEHLDVGDRPTLDLWGIVNGTNVTVRGR